MTFITHGFRVSVVLDVRERVRDFRITFALYVKKIFISWVRIYLGPKNLDTFWWNCQIIFRWASIHGRAGFILFFNLLNLFWHTDKNFCFYAYQCNRLIWNRHGHECSLIWKLSDNFIKKCRDFLGRYILGTTFSCRFHIIF
jgi:hypothetical protein